VLEVISGSPASFLADGRWRRIRFVPNQRLVEADLTRDLGAPGTQTQSQPFAAAS
jgi:hypothetical protein